MHATATSIRILGRRVESLEAEIQMLEKVLEQLVRETAPSLLALYGVGVDTAATLLVAAGDNPDRLRSEAAWANLCGVSPLLASSGKVSQPASPQPGRRPQRQSGPLACDHDPCQWPATTGPGPTSSAALPRGRASGRSRGSSSTTSPERSIDTSAPRRSTRSLTGGEAGPVSG
jgi:Transposase IS116/IS110/IS902 family